MDRVPLKSGVEAWSLDLAGLEDGRLKIVVSGPFSTQLRPEHYVFQLHCPCRPYFVLMSEMKRISLEFALSFLLGSLEGEREGYRVMTGSRAPSPYLTGTSVLSYLILSYRSSICLTHTPQLIPHLHR